MDIGGLIALALLLGIFVVGPIIGYQKKEEQSAKLAKIDPYGFVCNEHGQTIQHGWLVLNPNDYEVNNDGLD